MAKTTRGMFDAPGSGVAVGDARATGAWGKPVGTGFYGQSIGAVGGGGGTGGLTSIAGAYQSQFDAARQANEQRYGEILGGYGDLYGRVMGGLGERTEQAETDITRAYEEAGQAGQQRMVGRGLYNTTVAETMLQGVERGKGEAINRYRDQMLDRRLGYDVGLTGDRLGFMERRTDEYPDPGMLMQLMQMLGSSGGQLPPGIMDMLMSMFGGGAGGGAGDMVYVGGEGSEGGGGGGTWVTPEEAAKKERLPTYDPSAPGIWK